ncbi:MAG: hypothetical protein U5R48_14835 [Gammaproteobacteria bacterium]|nr:hypothetical protein [Gammaproteobacteria bacterium]
MGEGDVLLNGDIILDTDVEVATIEAGGGGTFEITGTLSDGGNGFALDVGADASAITLGGDVSLARSSWTRTATSRR